MICVAVFEWDTAKQATIKNWLVRYTVQRNCELELLWFTDQNPISKLKKYAQRIQIALVNVDLADGLETGKALYEQNPDCRILYYRNSPCDLEPLFSSRPLGFYLWTNGIEDFFNKMDMIYSDVISSQATFRYETKNKLYLLPKQNIMYLQSDLRYVNIYTKNGESPRILAKLSEIERLAGDSFLRIHKSYLVNPKHILWMDKTNHFVLLDNGEQLPVSDAQYENVCEKLR